MGVKIDMSAELVETSAQIGRRIVCDGDFATIRYIGEVASTEGVWFGVEWDNLSRGKHSGSFKDVHYFQTRVPNSGSFIRPKKAVFGISCPEAIRMKYGGEDTEQVPFSFSQKSGNDKTVEMVGFDKVSRKQSQFHKLTDIALPNREVNDPGAPGELATLVPNTTSLDLSCNLLQSWVDVIQIVMQLPHLESLILSKNRLELPDEMQNFQEYFVNMKTLVLNKMAYDWNQILCCALMWPSVENLYISCNEISSLRIPPSPLFSQLRSLSLDGNAICSWVEICSLGNLPSLEELYADNVKLESVSFLDVHPLEKTNLFQNLRTLTLRHNALSQWQDIAELNKLQSLKDLKITNNPIILSVNIETARQLVIAKLTALEIVNGTKVIKSERRGAEIDYIKKHHKDWLSNGGSKDLNMNSVSVQFLTEHPTYPELLKKHGMAEDSELAPQTVLLKNSLLSLEIYSSLLPNKPSIIKKIPATMPIFRLKALMHRIFRTPTSDIKLTWINPNDTSKGMEMDNDLRQLSFYSVSEGDKINVTW